MFGIGNLSNLFGGQDPGSAERNLRNMSWTGYSPAFLPPALGDFVSSPEFATGLKNLGGLMANPGGINPNISQAIAPWLANQSQDIATNYRGMMQNQAGSAARGNLPVSIKTALDSAMNVAQERAQRSARGEAMTQSEALRRQDLQSIMPMLQAIQGFVSSAHSTGVQGLGSLYQTKQGAAGSNVGGVLGAIGPILGAIAAFL